MARTSPASRRRIGTHCFVQLARLMGAGPSMHGLRSKAAISTGAFDFGTEYMTIFFSLDRPGGFGYFEPVKYLCQWAALILVAALAPLPLSGQYGADRLIL